MICIEIKIDEVVNRIPDQFDNRLRNLLVSKVLLVIEINLLGRRKENGS